MLNWGFWLSNARIRFRVLKGPSKQMMEVGTSGVSKNWGKEVKDMRWQWGTGTNTHFFFFFLLEAGPRGTDVDKGGNHEYSTQDVDHFKEAERNYIFNWYDFKGWLKRHFPFFPRIILFQKVVCYFTGSG